MQRLQFLLAIIVGGFMAVFLQETLFPFVLPLRFVPSVLILFVVYLAFFNGTSLGVCAAFFLGLILDLSGGTQLGPWASSTVVVFALLALLSDRIFVESTLSTMFLSLAAIIFVNGIYLLITFDQVVLSQQLMLDVTFRALVSALASPLFFYVFRRIVPITT